MKYQDSHPSDQQLLLEIDGELAAREERLVRDHLQTCGICRKRRQELETASVDFNRFHRRGLDAKLRPAAGLRALLRAQLAHASAIRSVPTFGNWRLACAGGLCALMILGLFAVRYGIGRNSRQVVVTMPDSRLTPGATLPVSRPAVCAQANIKNKTVPVVLQRKVFEEYGIAGADPRAYEVDYLVTPALGGADDIHNLWPHSYSTTVWNARVKDALEDHLRDMVCDGTLDLTEAQREIAGNWIAAYKKYFHTDKPLAEHGGQY